MSRTLRRPRLLVAVLSVSLLGAVFAADAQAAIPAGRDLEIVGNDPRAYTDPHAGVVAPPRAPGRLAPATGALIGTHSEDSPTWPLERQGILHTEAAVGRTMDIDNSYYGDFDKIANDYIPGDPKKRGLSKLAFWDIEMGRIPLVGWGCGVTSQINSGSKDAIIRKTAEAMKAFGHEFFMRYCWEMDGDKRTGEVGRPEEFVKAWIRMYNIFKEVGADNVVWVWTANANTFKYRNPVTNAYAWEYYPGDEYADWIAADGYNWAASLRNKKANYERDRWRSFVEIYDEFMTWARSTGPVPQSLQTERPAHPAEYPRKRQVKPIMIGEYGAIEPVGDIKDHYLQIAPYNTKPDWIRDTHDTVNGSKPRTAECQWCGIYSDIAAMVYFDITAENGPWIINSTPESTAAYREAGQDPWFNQIHTLGWAPASNRPGAPPPGQEPPPGPGPGPGPGNPPAPPGPPGQAVPGQSGYWMLGSDSKVYAFGDAKHLGAPALPAGATAADLEATPSGAGYWIVDTAGNVYANGDATALGGIPGGQLAAGESATSLSATPTGKGYWIFTNKGRAVRFGDATFFGDMSRVSLAGPVLDSIPTPTGLGYYMVGSDGGIFAFGDAKFHGSMGGKKLNAPVQSLVPDSDGTGYWLVASDGGIFAFDAPFKGSMGDKKLSKPVTGMVPFGDGYMMVGEDGGIFNFSTKPFSGSLGGNPPSRPIVAVAALD